MERRFITPERLREILGISETTELEWRRRKRIAVFKVGRVVRYDPAEVLEFIRRHTVRGRALGQIPNPESQIPNDAWDRIERLIADQVREATRQEVYE
jgi:bifunctional DNA-binding transcriptional regulator/antitoxin component of YhaV-PrlF toxin-antitoxin module